MIKPQFRDTLLKKFKAACSVIQEETGRAIRVDDRSHYREDGSFWDVVRVTIYPTLQPAGKPLRCGVISNFGKMRP